MATVMRVERMAKRKRIFLIVIRIRRGGFLGAVDGGGRLIFFVSGLSCARDQFWVSRAALRAMRAVARAVRACAMRRGGVRGKVLPELADGVLFVFVVIDVVRGVGRAAAVERATERGLAGGDALEGPARLVGCDVEARQILRARVRGRLRPKAEPAREVAVLVELVLDGRHVAQLHHHMVPVSVRLRRACIALQCECRKQRNGAKTHRPGSVGTHVQHDTTWHNNNNNNRWRRWYGRALVTFGLMVSSQGALSRCFSKVCASGEDDPGGGMIGFYSDGRATPHKATVMSCEQRQRTGRKRRRRANLAGGASEARLGCVWWEGGAVHVDALGMEHVCAHHTPTERHGQHSIVTGGPTLSKSPRRAAPEGEETGSERARGGRRTETGQTENVVGSDGVLADVAHGRFVLGILKPCHVGINGTLWHQSQVKHKSHGAPLVIPSCVGRLAVVMTCRTVLCSGQMQPWQTAFLCTKQKRSVMFIHLQSPMLMLIRVVRFLPLSLQDFAQLEGGRKYPATKPACLFGRLSPTLQSRKGK